jgi:hypothetical protein
MSAAGVNNDQSRIRPSRRADLSPRDYLEAPDGKPCLARLRRMIRCWLPAPAAERTTDCTMEDGEPTARADIDLPIDFG